MAGDGYKLITAPEWIPMRPTRPAPSIRDTINILIGQSTLPYLFFTASWCGLLHLGFNFSDYDLSFINHYLNGTQEAAGVVTRVERTRPVFKTYSSGPGSWLAHYKVHFRFAGSDSITYRDFSFVHEGGPTREETELRLVEGDTVSLEYPLGMPEKARIQGMERRFNSGSEFVFFVILPFCIGFAGMLPGVVNGLRAISLLRNGNLAEGRVILRRSASRRKRKGEKLTLTFEDDSGEQHKFTDWKAKGGVAAFLSEILSNPSIAKIDYKGQLSGRVGIPNQDPGGENELLTVIYHANNPSKARVLDCLPGMPAIEADQISVSSKRLQIGAGIIIILSVLYISALFLIEIFSPLHFER